MNENSDRERDWHNERYLGGADTRQSSKVAKFYSLASQGFDAFSARRQQLARKAKVGVLDLGCGLGIEHARQIRGVTEVPYIGVDVSDQAIDSNNSTCSAADLPDVSYVLSDANDLNEIETNSVDLVLGSGVLHHLSIPDVSRALQRVLVPGGRALFFEPLAYNPAIAVFRRLTPNLRSEDEHPLKLDDFRVLNSEFSQVVNRYFALSTLLAAPVTMVSKRATRPVVKFLALVDNFACRIPGLQLLSWICVIELRTDQGINGY